MRSLMKTYDIFNLAEDLFGEGFSNRYNNSLKVDIKENEAQYLFDVDIPGANKEDIKVNFEKGVLNITVEKSTVNEEKEGEKLIYSERSFSTKSRSFTVGENIDEENIAAEFKDGVLSLVLPKKEKKSSVKLIEIN